MSEQHISISCPKCNHIFDVTKALSKEVSDNLVKRYNQKVAELEQEKKSQESALQAERENLRKIQEHAKEREESLRKEQLLFQEKVDRQVQDQLAQKLSEQLSEERIRIEKSLREHLEQETLDRMKMYQAELEKKSEQLRQFHQLQADNERLKREQGELENRLVAENERKLSERLREEREKLSREIDERERLKVAEKEKIIEDLSNQLREAQRRAEQGSVQLQGEVQELAIESWLRRTFPLDMIDEIKKGERGGDCVQTINTRFSVNCGTIYYESKRAKTFSQAWIEKFKHDMRENGSSVGVLVTEVLPKDMERGGNRDGIWICTFDELKLLVPVLREMIIRTSEVLQAQEHRADNMSLLYTYLTSEEFRLHVEAIVEGFATMHDDLRKEKQYIFTQWKKREKQIEKVMRNTTSMYASIRSIAGNSIGAIKTLELPDINDDEIE